MFKKGLFIEVFNEIHYPCLIASISQDQEVEVVTSNHAFRSLFHQKKQISEVTCPNELIFNNLDLKNSILNFFKTGKQNKLNRKEGTWEISNISYQDNTGLSYVILTLSPSDNYHQSLIESIINSSDDAIISKTLEGIITSWNRGAEHIFGYKADEAIGKHISILIPEDLINEEDLIISKIKNGEHIDHYETERRHKNGSKVYISLSVSPIFDKQHQIIGASKIARDITKQKEEKERLKLLESTIVNTKDAILIAETFLIGEREPKIIYCNEAFLKMSGYETEEVIGKNLMFLSGPKTDQNQLKTLKSAILNKEPAVVSLINYKKNREEIWVNISISPVFNDDNICTHFIAIQRDITHEKRIEKEILEAYQEKDTILESIDDGFMAVDKDWTVSYWNNKVEQLLGINKEEILGKNLWDSFQESKKSKTYLECHKAIKTQKAVHFESFQSTTEKWFDISAYPSKNGLSIYFRDITLKKNIENQLLEVNEYLKTKTKELALSNTELEQFAYVASHDLQEPLRMITSFLSQLEKRYSDVIDEKGKRYIDFAVDGAKRMRQIILDLLEYSRVGRHETNLEEIDLNKLLKDIQILLRKKISEKNATFKIDELPVIKGFKAPLLQIFQNLVDNALKYSQNDVPPIIKINAKELANHWQFKVEDNGIGIKEEYFEKIFTIFQRLHRINEYSGTGMGLAITKKIVENLGGQIIVKQAKNQGSIFQFTIQK